MYGTISFLCRKPMEFDTQNWEFLAGTPTLASDLIGTALCRFELDESRPEIYRLLTETGETIAPDAVIEHRTFEKPRHLVLDYVEGHWERAIAEYREEARTPRYKLAMEHFGVTEDDLAEIRKRVP